MMYTVRFKNGEDIIVEADRYVDLLREDKIDFFVKDEGGFENSVAYVSRHDVLYIVQK